MTKDKKMLWGGRFAESPEEALFSYMSAENVCLDSRLISYDILGNRAHAIMLAEQKIISRSEGKSILSALSKVEKDYRAGKFKLIRELEDVHMNVESAVTKITPAGKKMHTARSRNDQVNLDVRLYMRDEAIALSEEALKLQGSFAKLAKKNADGIMVGYTHTRIAQPITITMWCDAYFDGFSRDTARLLEFAEWINQNPLGACALAGTSWPINRERTAELLGFSSVQENTLDVVNSRGEFELKLIGVLLASMLRASRLSEELIFLSEKGLVELPDRYTTGSSIMPQKKNPDVLELIRGRAARVLGNYVHIASLMKGLMNGHNADTQETKYALFMAVDTTRETLSILGNLVVSLSFNQHEIEKELERGFACATALADLIARKGVPFRSAHEITGMLVSECVKKKLKLSDLKKHDVERIAKVKFSDSEFAEAISPKKAAARGAVIEVSRMEVQAKKASKMKAAVAKAFDKLSAASV